MVSARPVKRAVLLIDHGSRRAEANEMLERVASLVRAEAGGALLVRTAHMELAEPTIAQGFAACVAEGATEVVALPFMLAPGRHAIEDIPRLVEEAARAHPNVTWRVAEPIGAHPLLARIVLDRAK